MTAQHASRAADLHLQALAGQLEDCERERLTDASEVGGALWEHAPVIYARLAELQLVRKLSDVDIYGNPATYAITTYLGSRIRELCEERKATLAVWAASFSASMSPKERFVLECACTWRPRCGMEKTLGFAVPASHKLLADEMVESGLLSWTGLDRQVVPTELGRATFEWREGTDADR